MGDEAAWLVSLQHMLRQRSLPSATVFHRHVGVFPKTAVWLWSFLAAPGRWPVGVPLQEHRLLWALWFLRTYPTQQQVIDVLHSVGDFHSLLWTYIELLAALLPEPPLFARALFSELPVPLQRKYALILDTLTVRCYSPNPKDKEEFHRRWSDWYSGEPKVKGFGVKVEVGASVSNHPVLLWYNIAPAGMKDGDIAASPGGLFEHLDADETVLTDGETTYQGSDRCIAPPHRGMNSFIPELDKVELTLQRGVERLNHLVRQFRIANDRFRLSPRDPTFWPKISSALSACMKLLSLDQLNNVDHY